MPDRSAGGENRRGAAPTHAQGVTGQRELARLDVHRTPIDDHPVDVALRERRKASIRAKVEHPFRVIKRQFGLMKVRFRGLHKNTGHLLTLFALSNLWMARKKLMVTTGAVRP